MEYVAGGKLTDIIARRLFENEIEIAAILKKILRALLFLHSKAHIHRDVKSENLLIGANGDVKLADFGFTAVLQDMNEKRKSVLGTPYFMAPEVIKGEPYDSSSDVWSLGIIALEMVEGVPPHFEESPVRALFLITSQPPPQLKKFGMWSYEFNDFLSKCLALNPTERWSCDQLLKHAFIDQEGTDDTSFLIDLLNK